MHAPWRLREHEHCTRTKEPTHLLHAHLCTATDQSRNQQRQHALRETDQALARCKTAAKHQRMGHPQVNQCHTGCPPYTGQTAPAPLHTQLPLHPPPPAHKHRATPFPSTTCSAMRPAEPRLPMPAHTHPTPPRLAHKPALRPKTASATPAPNNSNRSTRAEQSPPTPAPPARGPKPGAQSLDAPVSAR